MIKLYQKGFSLIELIVVVAIIGILASIAVPNFKRLVDSSRVGAQSSEFLTMLYFTRSEAVKRNTRVTMCKSADGAACTTSGTWASGWVIFVDAGTVGTIDGSDSILRVHNALTGNSTLVGSGTVGSYVSYTSNGQSSQSGQFDLCSSNTAVSGRDIVLNVGTGRPVVTIDDVPCS